MQMISAAGENSDFVAVLAMKTMVPNTWHVESVPGLSLSSHIGAKGIIYFSKTRCGTRDMWKDYFTRIVIPTIQASNAVHQPMAPDGVTPSHNMFSTDGEDIIISQCYGDDMRYLLKQSHIFYARVGAGTTGIAQACDRQVIYREIKKLIRRLLEKGIEIENRQLEHAIRQAFLRFKHTFPTVEFGKGLQDCYVEGLVILVHCFDKTMTRDTTIRGFTCCGQDCNPDENNCTVDFQKMMNQCYTNIPSEQRMLMLEQAAGFADIVKLRGKLTYKEVTANGILPGNTTIDRDSLTHIRHWSEVVTMDHVVECYREEMAAKDPAVIQQKKAAALVAKQHIKMQGNQKMATEKARKKASALVAKDNERLRVEALSPNSRQAEAMTKAQAKQQLKDAKIQIEMQEAMAVQAAKEFLAQGP
jgi:hypothetical protein